MPGNPLTDRLAYRPDVVVHDLPELRTELVTDCWTTERGCRIGRMVIDDFEGLGEYVSSIMDEFQDARRCRVYLSPNNIFNDSINANLEHRLTVVREGGKVSIDESGKSYGQNPFDPLFSAYMSRTPMIFDYDLGAGFGHGIQMVFEDLDRNSSRGHIYGVERQEGAGMVAVMPFYYREADNINGLICLEGDLRGRNSDLDGFSRAYWAAKLAMNASAQISSQLMHRFDSITNLPRRADFEVDMRGSIKQLIRHKVSDLYLMFVDLDNFKQINDTYTHPVGDEILRQVADMMQHSVRADDSVFRVGGEEFAVILNGVSYPEAMTIAERVRSYIEKISVMVRRREDGGVGIIKDKGSGWSIAPGTEFVRVTCSIGVVDVKKAAADRIGIELPPNGRGDEIIQEILKTAYSHSAELLHVAKVSGKNCICFAENGSNLIFRAAPIVL